MRVDAFRMLQIDGCRSFYRLEESAMPVILRRPYLQSFVAVCSGCAAEHTQTRRGVRLIAERLISAGNFNVVKRIVFEVRGQISAMYVLAESHCFVEVHPDRCIVLVNILSCMRFNEQVVRQALVTMVRPRHITVLGKRL